MDHNEFEYKLMGMLLSGEGELLNRLQEQYDQATITSRDISNVGFFTHFLIPKRDDLCIDNKSFRLGDVAGVVRGNKGAVGFVLFIKDGYISMLEGYTIAIERWPESYDEIILSYNSGDVRDISRLIEKMK